MAKEFHDINEPGYSFGKKKEEPKEKKRNTGIDDSEPVEKKKEEPEVRIISAEWKPGPKGFQYLEQCFLDVQTEFLPGKEKTIRLRIRGKLFGSYNGQEFDLSQEVVGYIDRKTGIARLEIKKLWFMDDHYPDWQKDPKTPCAYRIKGIFHSLGENVIDSPDLEMPAGHSLFKIEVEDVLFNHNSAVMLPEKPRSESSKQGSKGSDGLVISHLQKRATGLQGLRAILKYIGEHPEKSMLIVGHTDTSGEVEYNFSLSEMRANSVLHLLCDEPDQWARLCEKQHNVEDYQQILKHFAGLLLWSCDPGLVDNKIGPKTRNGVESFQQLYNTHRIAMHLGDADIPVQAPAGNELNAETWKAFFRLYQWELSIIVAGSENPDDLQAFRSNLSFVDENVKSVGCGESFPIDAKDKQNFKSQRNRRVEVLFFDAGESPESVEPPPQGTEVYTKESYPLYDENEYRSNYMKIYEPQFMPYLDIQTVDSLGFPVTNVGITISSDNEDTEEPYSVAVTTDDNAFVRAYATPVGKISIKNADGEILKFRSEGEEKEAVFEAHGMQNALLRIIVVRAVSEESVQRIEETYSIPLEPDRKIKSASSRERVINSFFGNKLDNRILTTDNLLLAAGLNGESMPDIEALAAKVIESWLADYYPQRYSNFLLLYLYESNGCFKISVYNNRGTLLEIFDCQYKLHGVVGTYTTLESQENQTFVDITYQKFVIYTDDKMEISIEELIPENQRDRFIELLNSSANSLPICYYLPKPAFYMVASLMGGVGFLECYRPETESDNTKIHNRNISVVKNHSQIYKAYIQHYIQKVAQCVEEQALRKLGPPIRVYKFPIPTNANSQQAQEIMSANDTARDELDAWIAINSKINSFIGRRASGLYLVAKINYTQDINKLQKVQVEYNFTYDSDRKVLQKVDKELLSGYTGEIDLAKIKKMPSKKSFEAGVEHELDLETGEGKLKGTLKVGAYGVEFTNDGCMKLTKQLHDRVELVGETNPNEMTMGFGTEITLNKDNPDTLDGSSKLFLGVSAQGLRPDTVMAVVSNAPGFFERRSLSALLSNRTKWNDLTFKEQLKLEVLGFTMEFWDDKHNHPLEDFPASATKAYSDLEPREQVAIVHLGFNSTTWPSEIKKVARTVSSNAASLNGESI